MVLGIVAVLGFAGPTSAQTAELRIGTEVLLDSPDTDLKVSSQVVATGAAHRLYRVGRISGDWLWIVAGDVKGWVRTNEVTTFSEAMERYDKEIASSPYSAGAAYFNRGNLWLHKREWARALDDFTEALKQSPKDSAILHNRGLAWHQLKEYNGAIADFTAALQVDPKYAWAYEDRGRAWAAAGVYDAAIADFTAELQLDPVAVPALLGRGLAFVETGQPEWAIADLTQALGLNPRLARAYTARGTAWKAKHEYQNTVDDLNAAIRLDPNDADALGALATIRATCPVDRYRNGSLAFAAASRALKLHGHTCAHCLDTLGAAYAEAGDFPKAVTWQTKALAALPDGDRQRDSFSARLALYRDKKPYRDLATAGSADSIAAAPGERGDGAR
jgi:tetratricopeptide (TPR) repeat protein